ncbi:hypothetical protein [Candidatus Aquiluna sp. UB-MaderosW2red]|uniref:hypothetical protein n=1 Tax=Candidatus Aquiluna sp. UB-MaderosW2red TaxID=1855377 RepID=UPI0012FC1580|nr:hypothetical protein [Candidatus Aquiluna sp. UB-MaderosW2red]
MKIGEAWSEILLDFVNSENSFMSGLTFVMRKIKDEGWDYPLHLYAAKANEFAVLAEPDIEAPNSGRSR